MRYFKRVTAFLLAAVLLVSDFQYGFADDISGNEQNDIVEYFEESEESSANIIEDVSANLSEDALTDDGQAMSLPDVSVGENQTAQKVYVDSSEYIVQLGGLDVPDDGYISELCDGFAANSFDATECENAIKEAVLAALTACEESIDIRKYQLYYDGSRDADDYVMSLVSEVINGHPELFYTYGLVSFDVDADGYITNLYFSYQANFDADKYSDALNAAYAEAITDNNAPDFVKVLQLHDWLCQHVYYDYTFTRYSAYDALVDGTAVCQGYTLAYEALLNKAGISNDTCPSNAMNHIWNIVQVGGKWYHVDTTWDDPSTTNKKDSPGRARHWYFLNSDSCIKNDDHNHYSWYTSHSCTDTTYDTGKPGCWFDEIDSQIAYNVESGRKFLYYQSSFGLQRYDYDRKASEIVQAHSFVWNVWDGGGYWLDTYSRMSRYENCLYYNSPLDVYKYDLKTHTETKIYTYRGGKGYIYGLLACKGKLNIIIDTSPYMDHQIKLTGPVSGKVLYGVSVSASTTKLTYGSSTLATLKASAELGFGEKGGLSYQWYVNDSPIAGATSSKYTVNPKNFDAGKYKFKVEVSLNGTTEQDSASVSITINAATPSLKNVDYPTSYTYSAEHIQIPQAANFSSNSDNQAEMTFTWYKSSELKASDELGTTPPKDAGTYYLKVFVPASTNYKAKSLSVKVVVSKAPLTVKISDQSIFWGDSVDSSLSQVEVNSAQLKKTDKLKAVKLVASTSELTTEGKITSGKTGLSIQNSLGEEVAQNYSVSFTSGILEIKKIPVFVRPVDQTIIYGSDIDRDISDEANNISRSVKAVIDAGVHSRYVVVCPTLKATIGTIGTGKIEASGLKVYKADSNTDVTKYCSITYEAGVLTVSRDKLSKSYSEEILVSYDDVETHSYNIKDLMELPGDLGAAEYFPNWEEAGWIDEFGIFEDIQIDRKKAVLSYKLRAGLDSSYIGKSVELKVRVTSENYEPIDENGLRFALTVKISEYTDITLDANGGKFEDADSKILHIVNGESLEDDFGASNLYHDFLGWYSAPTSGEKISTADGMHATLYAHWDEALKYTVSAPMADVASGTEVDKGTRISLTSLTNGAVIYYSLDGSEPSLVYNDAIIITEPVTIKAYGAKENYRSSEVITLTYTVSVEPSEIVSGDESSYVEDELWVVGIQDLEYTGKALKQTGLRVYDGKKLLTENTDYSVSYKNNVKAGTAQIYVSGKGNYTGKYSGTFAITPVDIGNFAVDDVFAKYSGKTQSPLPTVKFGTVTLKNKTDYTVEYVDKGTGNVLTKVLGDPLTDTSYDLVINGKGNYTGSKCVALTVTPGKLISKVTVSGKKDREYANGNEIKFVDAAGKSTLVVKDGKKTLVENEEYTITYSDNQNPGTARILITGTGEDHGRGVYYGTKSVTFKITQRSMSKVTASTALKSYVCTGEEIKPEVSLKYNKKDVLAEGIDYEITQYANNIKPGTMTIVITGKGLYKGTKKISVKLTAMSISKAKVEGVVSQYIYGGTAIEQNALKVSLAGAVLNRDTDYTVSYKDNSKAGTATVVVTGTGRYTGTVKKTFKIAAYNLLTGTGHNVSVSYNKVVSYEKGGSKPAVTITFDGNELALNKDYTVSYSNNTTVGNKSKLPTITIKGKGNFTGTLTRQFGIQYADISALSISVADKTYACKAGNTATSLVITDKNGKKLTAGTDYNKKYTYRYAEDVVVKQLVKKGVYKDVWRSGDDEVGTKDIIPVGAKIKITVKGKGNYLGTIESTYRIITKSISSASVKVNSMTYTGKAVTPGKSDITVKIGGEELTYADYEIVSYSKNVKKGTATLVIRGIGNYSGTKTVKFTIKAKSWLKK